MGSNQSAVIARDAQQRDIEVNDAAAFATKGGGGGGHQQQQQEVIDASAGDLSSKVEMNIICINLPRKYNYMIVANTRRTGDDPWEELARTEVVTSTTAPRFIRSIIVEYVFEQQTYLRFNVYNCHNPAAASSSSQSNYRLSDKDVLAYVETTVAEVVGGGGASSTRQFQRPLLKPSDSSAGNRSCYCGDIIIHAAEVNRVQDTVILKVTAEDLPVKDTFSRSSDPYLVVYRSNEPPTRRNRPRSSLNTSNMPNIIQHDAGESVVVPIYKSEVHTRTLNPQWSPFELSMHQLCRGDENRDIHLEVNDWNRNGESVLIGSSTITYTDLYRVSTTKRRLVLCLYDPRPRSPTFIQLARKAIRKVHSLLLRQAATAGERYANQQTGYEESISASPQKVGYLIIEEVTIQRRRSFLEYILGGLEVCLLVGIDFTRSNGDPRYSNSLHKSDTKQPNDYVMAIRSVGEILEHYDSDKRYPVFGFGARLPPTYTVYSNCFSLNGNFFDPEVHGIDGIVEVYRRSLQVTYLHGPTKLNEVIRVCRQWSAEFSIHASGEVDEKGLPVPLDSNSEQKYFILLLITDGFIDDLQETIDEIVESSKAPMSIIIVGVGDGDFSQMDVLDSDDAVLVSSRDGTSMDRDIVQFVPFDEFKGKSNRELAIATLEEIPREVVNYFQKRGIQPMKPKADHQVMGGHHHSTAGFRVTKASPKKHRGGYEDQVIHNAVEEHKQMQAFKNRAAANIAAASRHERDQQAFQLPTFMKDIQEVMIDNLTWQGYREDDIRRVLSDGIPSPDPMYVIDVLSYGVSTIGGPFQAELNRIRRSHALGGQQQQQQPSDTHLLLSASYNAEDRLREMREAIGEHPSPPPGTVAVREDIHKKKKKGNRRSSLTMGNRLSSFRTPHKKIDEFGRYLPNADDDDEGDTIDPNNICKICYCRPVDCRLERCGHEISCYSCAMTSSVGKICPLCRQTVVMVINKAPPPPPSPAIPTSS